MNMARSLLVEKNIPKTFWEEAVNWAIHVLNRSPTVAVKNITPEEAWSGVKPSVSHFRVFGCISHAHVPDSKCTKLDDKSIKCVLLGISEESKAYRLYEPISQKILVSRDVVFEENNSWEWDKDYEKATLIDLEWGDDENGEPEPVAEADGGEVVAEVDLHDAGRGKDNSRGSSSRESSPLPIHQGRERRQPVWMRDYVSGEGLSEEGEEDEALLAMLATSTDPIYFEDAAKNPKWRKSMDAEIDSIEKNGTWELTDLPTGAKKVGVKWVYKTKLNEHGEVDKLKSRLVAKGYTQEYGVDYTEVFTPVARMETVRLVVSLIAQKQWNIYQLDVKSTFLHGDLDEDVYVEQPPGYKVKGQEDKVYKLNKALYGLKQAPRAWYSRIESYFTKEGFLRCPYEHTLFIKVGKEGKILIVCLYVDDLIFTGNDETVFVKFKKSMMQEFYMTDLGKMRYFLGIEVVQESEGFFYMPKEVYGRDLRKVWNDWM